MLVEADRFIFSLREQPDGSYSLVRKTAAGAVQPAVDFVSGLLSGNWPERRRRVLSGRAGRCLAQCRGAERCSCEASFPIACFAPRSDCEMCHERRTWNRVGHGDPIHCVPVGAGFRAVALRVHGSIGDRQHDWLGRDVVRGRRGYRARGARSCRNAGLGCRPLRCDARQLHGWSAGGARKIPGGGTVDLTAATNLLNCRKSAAAPPLR